MTTVPFLLAPWLLTDSYDYVDEEKYLSVTSLLKPTRAIALSILHSGSVKADLEPRERYSSILGTAIHNSVESSWINLEPSEVMADALGVSKKALESISINGKGEGSPISIWLEQRALKPFRGWVIGGKFDAVVNGQVQDVKSTSVMSYQSKRNIENYVLQGSLYRWLNQELITKDFITINYVLTDWKMSKTSNPEYPPSPFFAEQYELLSLGEIEAWLTKKLLDIEAALEKLPLCTDKELWRDPPVYKYYSDPTKTTRATKVFTSQIEAVNHSISKGKGVVIPVSGTPVRCKYCSVAPVCSQKASMT